MPDRDLTPGPADRPPPDDAPAEAEARSKRRLLPSLVVAVARALALLARVSGHALGWLGGALRGRVVELVGGPARARVIGLFGGVLALASAQTATVGAVAPQLELALHIHNTKIGLLNSVALLIGAAAVIPVGLLVDRFRRIPILALSMLLWSAATIVGAFATSYSMLLLTRLGLGAVTATAGPAIASLTGDYFPSHERSRVYGYILSGEIAGTAAGFVLSGALASLFSWRVAFFVLGIPGLLIARSLWRTVPEPRRGGQSRLAPGTMDLDAAVARAQSEAPERAAEPATPDPREDRAGDRAERDLAFEAIRERGVVPDPDLVLDRDPDSLTLAEAVRYVLRIPTNVMLIVGSSLGYFFFAGLQTFAVVFLRGRYHASEGTATLMLGLLVVGALIGTLVAGPISDAITRRGTFEARIWVPAVGYLGAVAVLIPGFLMPSLGTAIWFDMAGAALISAANPPLDAARLDIMPSGLWGRAESVRTFLRSLAQAIAPLLFGEVSDLIAGFVPQQAPIGTHTAPIVSAATGTGLQIAFLIMLVSLAAAGFFLLRARGSYLTDVATAEASFHPSTAAAAPADHGPSSTPVA